MFAFVCWATLQPAVQLLASVLGLFLKADRRDTFTRRIVNFLHDASTNARARVDASFARRCVHAHAQQWSCLQPLLTYYLRCCLVTCFHETVNHVTLNHVTGHFRRVEAWAQHIASRCFIETRQLGPPCLTAWSENLSVTGQRLRVYQSIHGRVHQYDLPTQLRDTSRTCAHERWDRALLRIIVCLSETVLAPATYAVPTICVYG